MAHPRRASALAAAAAALLVDWQAFAVPQAGCAGESRCDGNIEEQMQMSLMQKVQAVQSPQDANAGAAPQQSGGSAARDLAFVHVPWNFGHTIEKVGALGTGANQLNYLLLTAAAGPSNFAMLEWNLTVQQKQAAIQKFMMPGGQQWGMLVPELAVTSPDTGCPMYLTPQRFWPKDVRERYFGGRKAFGVLRDPYERLVAIFRGNIGEQYGGLYPGYFEKCDVNGAVKLMMQRYKNSTNKYAHGCVFLPQSEYFEDKDHPITVPVDNRLFPDSMNAVFEEHGYNDMLISTSDILHVMECTEVWAADLDAEARQLVREVYARDFQLLCDHFGYCDKEENVCLTKIPQMCPKVATA